MVARAEFILWNVGRRISMLIFSPLLLFAMRFQWGHRPLVISFICYFNLLRKLRSGIASLQKNINKCIQYIITKYQNYSDDKKKSWQWKFEIGPLIQHASSRFTQHFKLLNGWMPLFRPPTMPSTTLSSFLHFDLTSREKECRIIGKSASIFFFFFQEKLLAVNIFDFTQRVFYFILFYYFLLYS
jgi:hypothetical protein